MVGFVIAVLMVVGFIVGIIQQFQREMEKSRAKGPRVGSTRPLQGYRERRSRDQEERHDARYKLLSGRNLRS